MYSMQIMKDAQRSKRNQKKRKASESDVWLSSSHLVDESLELIRSDDVGWRGRSGCLRVQISEYAAHACLSEEGAGMTTY